MKSRRRGLFIFFLLTLTVLAVPLQLGFSSGSLQIRSGAAEGSAYITDTENFLKIGNSFLEITIRKTDGAIYSLVEKSTGVDFIRHKDVLGCLFWLIYYFPGTGEVEGLVGGGASVFQYVTTVEASGAWLNMTWSGLFSWRKQRQLDITVRVSINAPSESTLSYWYIAVDNNENGIIEKIGFPLIFGVGQISDEVTGDYLVIPQGPGILSKNPQLNLKPGVGLGGVYYPSAFFNMQFIAYYARQVNKGLYLADYDSSGTFVKYFSAVNREGRYLEVFNEHIPEFHPKARMALPYPVVVGFFEGDWWDAAQLYKSWASEQWWAARGTIAERDDIPQWLKKTGIMADVFTRFWSRNSTRWNGPFSNLPKIADVMRQYYGSAPLLWWRGWEKHGFGMAPPEVFPPTEGWDSFKDAVSLTHAKGGRVSVLPYTSIYSFNATGWQDFVPHAPRDREGNLYVSRWSIHNNSGQITWQAGFIVSPGERWRNKILQIVEELALAGVDMVQLDGNPIIPFVDWYGSERHWGGGDWWAEGLIAMFSNIREEVRRVNPEFALGGEWYAEPYVPFLDAVNEPSAIAFNPFVLNVEDTYNYTLNTFIPLWHAVYHEYQIMYSTLAFIDKVRAKTDKSYFLRGLAIAFIWGEIPMVDMDPQGTGEPHRLELYDAEMLEYSRRIAQARTTYAYPYLVEGRMLRPLELEGIPLLKIARAKQVPYTGADIPPFMWPCVMGSAWEAPDGSIGIILTSICDSQVSLSIPLSKLDPGRRIPAYLVRNGEYGLFNSEPASLESLTLILKPMDVYLLVLEYPENLATRFEVGNLVINPASIRVGQSSNISVTVKNTGMKPGMYEIILKVNNSVIDAKTGILGPNQSATTTFTYTPTRDGVYIIEVNGSAGVLIVVQPARFEVSNLVISPVSIKVGEFSKISATVKNVGGEPGTYEVKLKVNNQVVYTKTVTLDPGESTTITFSYTPTIDGTYGISIDGLTGVLTVTKETIASTVTTAPRTSTTTKITETFTATNIPWLLITGAIVVTAAIVLAIILLRSRKPPQAR